MSAGKHEMKIAVDIDGVLADQVGAFGWRVVV
jgi:hypothetical protein